jgi:hypothetical protein
MCWGYGEGNKINLLGVTSFGKNICTSISFSFYMFESEVLKPFQQTLAITHNSIQEYISSKSEINKFYRN